MVRGSLAAQRPGAMLWVMAKYAPPIHKGQGTLVLPHAIWPRLVVFLIVLFINAVFPRMRTEQAVKYLWRWPTLLAFIGLIVVLIMG